MTRVRSQHVCQACGAVSSKWAGRCESCGAWNRIVEEAVFDAAPGGAAGPVSGQPVAFEGLAAASADVARIASGVHEFDLVCGGGLVPGSAVLVGGEPGIGKSTLLLQVAGALARRGPPCVYVSGEEAVDQIRQRALRLGVGDSPVRLAAATEVGGILAGLEAGEPPALAVIDSVQTMFVDGLD